MLALEQTARDILSDLPEISFAVLFGSGASGKMTRSSDVDLAVRFAPEAAPKGWSFGGLVSRLEKGFGRPVQLVDLSSVRSAVLQREIAKGLLVKGASDELVALRVKAFRDWRDFGPRFRRCAAAMLRHFANEKHP